ncbi:peptidase inhibitor family I36 protein, partial [Streptomyces sp. T-3]|nr:peptidase inhibitor family I36 protein [Streptomyces sp. T-3]
ATVAGVVTALTLSLGGSPEDTEGKGPVGATSADRNPAASSGTGYDRCNPRSVCFFTEKDGQGKMCAWEGDDVDWTGGENACSWTTTDKVRSVFNNGTGITRGEKYIEVDYYAKPLLRERLGCVVHGTSRNLPEPLQLRSHTWAKKC